MGSLIFLFFPWGLILQAIAIVHFIRRRPDGYWLWIIIFFGGLGALIYIAAEVIPDAGLARQSFKVFTRPRRIHELEPAILDNHSAGNYEELADLPDVPKELKQESEVLVGRLLLRGAKYSDAEKRLEKLSAGMSEGDAQRPFVQAYLAESRIGQNKLDSVEKDLKELIRGTTDSRVRGVAYNLLGDFYTRKGQAEDAFWSYLRVDAMYNEDAEEQAKALYRLTTLFDKVKKDPIRGKECADRLQSKRFNGTTYQKLAKTAETKEK
jgi:hypothetical protein